MSSDQARRRAEKLFKKEERLQDGQQAMTEYQAEREAVRMKTARLRALRLSRSAADQSAVKRGVSGGGGAA
jgi:hypothetical protein